MKQLEHDVAIGFSFSRGIGSLIAPLHPAAAVANAPFFFQETCAGQLEDLCLDFLGVHARALPERSCFAVKDIDIDHPVKLCQGLANFSCMSTRAGWIHPPSKESGKGPFIHLIKKVQPRGILGWIKFWHP